MGPLIEKGADLDAVDDYGNTALMITARHNYTAIAFRLLCSMTPEQIQAFSNKNQQNFDLVNTFKQALKVNANRIYDIIMP